MGMRLLTERFTSYNIAQAEKKFKKDFMDFIDVGNLSFSKMITLIQMGNFNCEEEVASKKLDNFLADENNGLVDAYLQILDELNRDTKILKGTGVSIDELRKSIFKEIEDATEIKEEPVKETQVIEFKQEIKENETPKVDVNGFVSLD